MTADSRYERDLTSILEDLYLGPPPDYQDEVVAGAVRHRQRPAWTFPGRWFPVADIASQQALSTRVPLRAIGLALLVIALTIVATVLVVGSRQTRVPDPFGVAGNGLIVYESGGDIYTLDPETGASHAVVTGPERDTTPMFSPDGTRILFRRNQGDSSGVYDLVVVGTDGSNPVVLNTETLTGDPGAEWAYDSRSVVAEIQAGIGLRLFDATRTAEPRILSTKASAYGRPYRPPDGRELLLIGFTSDGWQLSLLDIASGVERILVPGRAGFEFGGASWSPDGSRIVFSRTSAEDTNSRRLFMVNADGTGMRQLTDADGRWFEIDPVWSPDGTRIVFTRYQETGPGTWDIRRTGIYDVASGTISEVGPLPRDVRAQHPTAGDGRASAGEGFYLDWSPDARTLIAQHTESPGHLVLIDPDEGDWQVLDVVPGTEGPGLTWQRTAQEP